MPDARAAASGFDADLRQRRDPAHDHRVVASIEANEALKILSGHPEAISRTWTISTCGTIRCGRSSSIRPARRIVLAAASIDFPGLLASGAVTPPSCAAATPCNSAFPAARQSARSLETKLAAVGQVSRNKYLVRATIGTYNLTVFPDGRAVIGGTEDIAEAKSVYAKYVGRRR